MARSTLQVRLVTVTAGLAAIFAMPLVSACSVGQVAETAEITAAVPGGNATVPVAAIGNTNSAILVQNATIPYTDPAGYPKGSDAPLSMRIVNQTPFPIIVQPGDVTLTTNGVDSPAGTLGWADDKHKAAVSAPSASPSESPSGPAGPPNPSASPSASPSEAPTPVAPTFADIAIAPFGAVDLNPQAGQYLAIQGLLGPLAPGTVVNFHLNFKVDASKELGADGRPSGRGTEEVAAEVQAAFAPPQSPAPRTTG